MSLKEGGESVAVTEWNKGEYLRLFVEHRLVGAIREQLQAFKSGMGVYVTVDSLI